VTVRIHHDAVHLLCHLSPAACRLQRHHTAVSTIGYDDKSGLLVIAGDSGHVSSSSSSSTCGSHASSSSGSSAAAAPAAAFAQEGVTVSVWHLQERELTLKFALGEPQVGEGCDCNNVMYGTLPL
jgi:hypothetical protein